jgi:DUF3011 family protein
MRRLSCVILFVVFSLYSSALKSAAAEEPGMMLPVLVSYQRDFVFEQWSPARPTEDGQQPRLIYTQWGPGGQRTVQCESQNDRYAYCRTYTSGRVRLQRQLSDAPCREYETWGMDGDGSGIWVRNGCRAVFVVGGGGGGGGGRRGGTITCKSEHFEYNRCLVYQGRGKVRLSRQLSDASCVRGSSWGVERDGIWVNNGCAAEFEIR